MKKNDRKGRRSITLAPPRTIQGAIIPSPVILHIPRESHGHNCRGKSKLRTQRSGHPVWTPPRTVLGKLQDGCQGVKPVTVSQCWSTFWTQRVSIQGCRVIVVPWVGRDPRVSLSPTPACTLDHPKCKPYVWKSCPSAPWILAAWGHDQQGVNSRA